VIATDTDTRFLRMLERPNLTVLEHDITTDDPLPGPFDLVHSRALLAHLPERQAVVTRMVSEVRPGGWIVIEDVDFASVTPLDPDPAFDRLVTAMTTLMERAGIDRRTGRKLRRMLVAGGVADAMSEGRVHVIDGSNPVGSLTFETLGPRIVAAGLLGQEEVDSVLGSMKDPTYEWVSPVMFAAWGRRSGA
jgi:SAM-dependent methyltransferase